MFHKSARISAKKESFRKIFCHMIVHGYKVNLPQKLIFPKLAPKGDGCRVWAKLFFCYFCMWAIAAAVAAAAPAAVLLFLFIVGIFLNLVLLTVECLTFPDVAHGAVSGSSGLYSTLTLTCDIGYEVAPEGKPFVCFFNPDAEAPYGSWLNGQSCQRKGLSLCWQVLELFY